MRLENKVAIITGAGNGIGECTAYTFAREGATIVVADIKIEAATRVRDEIITRGGKAIALKVDVADRESVDQMVQDVLSHYGRIDVLLNNAGITKDSSFLKMDQTQWQQVIDINLTGVFNCTHSVAPHMVKQGGGSIINASSVVGIHGNFGQANYSATKGALISMTKTLAKELGRKKVRVNSVAPGFIATEMTAVMPENVLKMMSEKCALQRMGLPEEIANCYLFLASDESSFVTGTTLSADGGF